MNSNCTDAFEKNKQTNKNKCGQPIGVLVNAQEGEGRERAAEEEGKSTTPGVSPQISRAQRAIGGSLQFITSNSSSVGETHHYEESAAMERLERRRGADQRESDWSSLTI